MKTALELSMNYDSIPLSKRLAGINEGRPQLQTKTLNADDPPADWKPDVEIDWSNINKVDRETGIIVILLLYIYIIYSFS